jgi:hypothetical protein
MRVGHVTDVPGDALCILFDLLSGVRFSAALHRGGTAQRAIRMSATSIRTPARGSASFIRLLVSIGDEDRIADVAF